MTAADQNRDRLQLYAAWGLLESRWQATVHRRTHTQLTRMPNDCIRALLVHETRRIRALTEAESIGVI